MELGRIKSRRRLLILVVAGACIVGGMATVNARPAAPLDAGETSFSYQSSPGDLIGQGLTHTFTTGDATIGGAGALGGIGLSVRTGSEFWDIRMFAPPGSHLSPGLYTVGEDSSGGTNPVLDVSGHGLTCTTTSGTFFLRALSVDAYGDATLFDATFTQHCNSPNAPPLTGTVKFHAPPSAPVGLIAANPTTVRHEPATFTANVSPATSGYAEFFDGGAPVGLAPVDADGFASLTTTTLQIGDHSITATFDGETSDAVVQHVRSDDVSFWYTSLGNPVALRTTANYAAPPDTFFVEGDASQLKFFVQGPDNDLWQITFAAPAGATLHPGLYPDVERAPFQTAGHAGLDIAARSGCNHVFGSFDVSEIETDALGIRTFVASFTHYCEFLDWQPLFGTLSYHRHTVVRRSLQVSPPSLAFGTHRVGTASADTTVTLKNTGNVPLTLANVALAGASPRSFASQTTCFPGGKPRSLAAGASCRVYVSFTPRLLGNLRAQLRITDNADGAPHSVALAGTGSEGYLLAGTHGEIGAFGDAPYHGDATKPRRRAPIAAITATPDGGGYWLVASDGAIFPFGNAQYFGSMSGIRLGKPIVGMAATPDGAGYWLVASDGAVFPFGNAHPLGSMAGKHLNKPIVGIVATPNGRGYWLAGSDGGVFAFGNAGYHGAKSGTALNAPITGMRATLDGRGYWLVASDGGIFAFGNARYFGSAAGSGAAIVGMAATPDSGGYWLVGRDGRVLRYGNAPHYGDFRAVPVSDVVGIATTAPPLRSP